jgi:peptidoglycan/LPS O-acetylase OafA/YrhL
MGKLNQEAAPKRVGALDGLRGIAALTVVAFHFLCAFAPGSVGEPGFETAWWVDTPLNVFLNGNFAVHVFFVLSAFVLAQSSLTRREHLAHDLLFRYLRLAVPAATSVLLAWALLLAFPVATQALRQVAPAPWLQWTHQQNIPGFFGALADGFWGIFWTGQSLFNNVLWTMQIELLGSFGVYLFFQFCDRRRPFFLLVIALTVLLAKLPAAYLSFVLGAGLCLAVRAGVRLGPWQTAAIACASLVAGFPSTGFAERAGLQWLPWRLQPGHLFSIVPPAAALMLVLSVLSSPALGRFFAHRINCALGRLSFPLYLVHVPLIYTLFATAAVQWDALSTANLFLTIGLPYLVTCLALAWLFTRAVDEPVLTGLKRLRAHARHRLAGRPAAHSRK